LLAELEDVQAALTGEATKMDAAVAVANALAKMIFFNVVLRAGAP
jgi:hypothetical protein